MTIEEKAKGYDEALKVLHKYDGAHIMFTQDLKEEMFPELKENGDERIRKGIISGMKALQEKGKYTEFAHIPLSDVFTWLEKQGQVKETDIPQHENKTYKENGNSLTSEDERIRKEIIAFLKYYHTGQGNCVVYDNDWIAWLEKQAKHANFCNKIQVGDKVTRNQDGVLVNLSQLNRVAKKQGGQKPYGQKEECFDCQMNYAGECKGSCTIKRDERKETLCDQCKKKHPSHSCQDITELGRCALEKQDEKEQDPCENCENVMLNCHNFPCIKKRAFKQGKSTLEAIINEKVDNSNKVEPKFKVGDVVTNKKSKDTVKIVQILHDSYCYSGWDGAATVNSDFSISEQDDWELVHQTPAWSNEDENEYTHILKTLNLVAEEQETKGYNNLIGSVNWLKSLRYRVQPQTKQEWSEEDKNYKDALISLINEIKNQPLTRLEDWDSYLNWLKSLRYRVQPQTKQELSEEDYNKIETIACHLDNTGNEVMAKVLRNIRDKYYRTITKPTWKPGDGQISLLQSIVNDSNNAASESCQIALKEVIKQLKKLREE